MQTNYVPKHSRDHANSEYVSYGGQTIKRAKFIGSKQTNLLTRWHMHTKLYILVQIILTGMVQPFNTVNWLTRMATSLQQLRYRNSNILQGDPV